MLGIIEFDQIKMDLVNRRLWVRNKEKKPSPKLFNILKFFLLNQGRVLTRNYLLDQLWEESPKLSEKSVDVHICWLREILEDQAKYLHTIKTYGYRFN